MFLKIVKPPTGEIPGVSLDHFRVGRTYEVGTQVACVFIAEGWAEIASERSIDAVFTMPEAPVAIRGAVLVVDDEPDVQRLTQTLLTLNGYHVVVARHGKEAIQRLKDYCPDLIVLDLNMPVMNGWQFRAEQRHLSPKAAAVPVLLMSGEDDAHGHAVALNAIGVVQKPVAAEALLDAVRRVIGK